MALNVSFGVMLIIFDFIQLLAGLLK